METDEDRPDRAHWRELLPHREDVLLEGFALFRGHLVAAERRAGLVVLRVRPWTGPGEHEIAFDEPAYAAGLGVNLEPDTATLRFHYSSMVTPESVYDYDMTARTRTLRKREEVLGGYDPPRYETLRLEATAADGVQVPISLVRRRSGTGESGAAAVRAPPLLLYGYGSYGISMEASFSSPRLSLLDRGFAFAIAHVRGGEELGRRWYDDGKLQQKKNTFTDFIACAEQLVAAEHAAPDRLYAMGGSAGGLLMGAVVNMRPDLFHGVVAQVPFVDVLTTMLDETIPLTTGEYDEWGNPNEPRAYEYIRSYSPYDNMQPVPWPHLLVMTGLHDSQVQYWEPAKWVARRRAMQPGDGRRLLLKTNMEAGHGGASGRYRRYRELALQYAFPAGSGGEGAETAFWFLIVTPANLPASEYGSLTFCRAAARMSSMFLSSAGQDASESTIRAGFRFGNRGAHTSRTIMLAEVADLFAAVEPGAAYADYRAAVADENVLGKPTIATRRSTCQRLRELYALDPRVPIFRVLRRLWRVDVPGRPLLAMLCALARDPLLRATAPAVLALPVGSELVRSRFLDGIRQAVGIRSAERGSARQGSPERRQLMGAGGASSRSHAQDSVPSGADTRLSGDVAVARGTRWARGHGLARLSLEPRAGPHGSRAVGSGPSGNAARPDPRPSRRRRGRD